MQLPHLYTATTPHGLVIINLGPPEIRTPLTYIRSAARALRAGKTRSDVTGGVNTAIVLLDLAGEAVARGGWQACASDLSVAIAHLKRAATDCARNARGTCAAMLEDILGGADDALRTIGSPHVS